MYSPSLKNLIYNYVKGKYPELVHKGDIERKSFEWGFETENCGRRCRELEKGGRIEKLYIKNLRGINCVAYKWIPPLPEKVGEERVEELARSGAF